MVQNLVVGEALTKLEHNLKRLTLDMLDVRIDDFLLRYQRHTVGVHGSISRLL